jgi:hypothetical protein
MRFYGDGAVPGVSLLRRRAMEPVPFYRPGNPRATPLWKLAETHYERFPREWEQRFEVRFGFWRGLADEAVARYLPAESRRWDLPACGVTRAGEGLLLCGSGGMPSTLGLVPPVMTIERATE